MIVELKSEEKDLFRTSALLLLVKEEIERFIKQNSLQGQVLSASLKRDGEDYYFVFDVEGIKQEEVNQIYENTKAGLTEEDLDKIKQVLIDKVPKVDIPKVIEEYHEKEGMSLKRLFNFFTISSFIREDYGTMDSINRRKLIQTLADFGFEPKVMKGKELKEYLIKTNQSNLMDLDKIDENREYLFAEKTKHTLLVQIAKGLQTDVSIQKGIGGLLKGFAFASMVFLAHVGTPVGKKVQEYVLKGLNLLVEKIKEMIEEKNEVKFATQLTHSDLYTIFKTIGVSNETAIELANMIKSFDANKFADFEVLQKQFFEKLEGGLKGQEEITVSTTQLKV